MRGEGCPSSRRAGKPRQLVDQNGGALGNDRAMILHLRGAGANGSAARLTFLLEVLSAGFKEDAEERCSRWRVFTGSSS